MTNRAKKFGDGVQIWCPACDMAHSVNDRWTFNGSLKKPTVTPSLMVRHSKICHSIITDGKIAFCSDSTHHLKGQTVDLPEWPFND